MVYVRFCDLDSTLRNSLSRVAQTKTRHAFGASKRFHLTPFSGFHEPCSFLTYTICPMWYALCAPMWAISE
jgi:hypothetical protein